MVHVTSKADVLAGQNLLAQEDDPWADFRQIERLNLEMTQRYRHSLGKYSRFFLELEQKRLLATTCVDCARTYAPPRPLCPRCLNPTIWTELTGHGTLKTWSVMHFAADANDDVRAMSKPLILAYVLLDGADTLFPHLLHCAPEEARSGLRVRVAWAAERRAEAVQHPIHLMHFVPLAKGG